MKFGFIKYINPEKLHGYVVEIDTISNLPSDILKSNDGLYFPYEPNEITFERYELVTFESKYDKQGRIYAKPKKFKWSGVVTSPTSINLLNPILDSKPTINLAPPTFKEATRKRFRRGQKRVKVLELNFELGTIVSFTSYFTIFRSKVLLKPHSKIHQILNADENDDLYELQNSLNDSKTVTINRIALDWNKSLTDEQGRLYKSAFLIELDKIDEAYNILKDIKGNDLRKSYSFLRIYFESINYKVSIEKIFKKWEKDDFLPTHFFSKEDFQLVFKFIKTRKFKFRSLYKYLTVFEQIDKKVALDFLDIVLNSHAYVIHNKDLENWEALIYRLDYLHKILPYVTDNVRFDLWFNDIIDDISIDIIGRAYNTAIKEKKSDIFKRLQSKVIHHTSRNEFDNILKYDLWLEDGQFPPSIPFIEKQYWQLKKDSSENKTEIDKIINLSKSLTDFNTVSDDFKFDLWLNGVIEEIAVDTINHTYATTINEQIISIRNQIQEKVIDSKQRNEFSDDLKFDLWLEDGQFPPSIPFIEKQYWQLKKDSSENKTEIDKIINLSKSLTDVNTLSDNFKFDLWLNGAVETIDVSIIDDNYKAAQNEIILRKVEELAIGSSFRNEFEEELKFNLWLKDGQFSPSPSFIEKRYNATKQEDIKKIVLKVKDFSGFSESFKFELWCENNHLTIKELNLSIADFDKQFWIEYEKRSDSSKNELIQSTHRLSLEEVLSLNQQKKIKEVAREKLKKQLASTLTIFCFDLEIRYNNLTEVCFIDSTLEANNAVNINDTFKEGFHKADLIIGHNIIEFDLKELAKRGVKSIKNTSIWDTLRVEAMLSPTSKSLALDTQHNAKEDTLLTFDLFFHQVCRLLALEQSVFEDFAVWLPQNVLVWLREFREKIVSEQQRKCLNHLFNRKYCKESVPSEIVKQIIQILKQVQNENVVLQIPYGLATVMTEVMSDFPEMTSLFEPNEEQPLLQNPINVEAIELIKHTHFAYTAANFALRQKNNTLLFEQLSPYLQRCILSQVELEQISIKPTKLHFQDKLKGIIYGDQYHLVKFKQFIPSNAVFINFFEEVAIWKDKVFVQKMTFDEIKALPNGDTIWTKFSGGQGFAEMDNEMKSSEKLKQKLSKMWIEKVNFETFHIWGRTNENITQFVDFQDCKDIKIPTPEIDTSFVVVNQRSLRNINQVRLNATTAYRDRYWHFQTKIIEELISKSNLPIVWFIQPSLSNEVDLLQQLFRKRGFFIPDVSLSLSRQVERLVQHNKKDKLLVIDFKKLEAITAVSHFPMIYVIDNLKVEETYFLSNETKYKTRKDYEHEAETDEDTDENEDTTQTESKSFRNDIEALLDLTRPHFEYIQFLIQANNKENELCCIDSHFDSYKSVVKQWNIKRKICYLWNIEKDFNDELSELSEFSRTSNDERIDWKYDEAKKIISKIFIKGYPFYDHQVLYLNKILEAKENILVSLPTGGGKSVLFQGPALYRSSLTNKLTIVVTPLKALMEDQVYELQELGFWNSVDFINSDRNLEIDHIYKKIAGGELNIIYVTPERFRSRRFIQALKLRLEQNGGFEYIVFDEAHCISQWGNEFRPDYHNGAKKAYEIKITSNYNFPILLFSATVSDKVLEEFKEIFNPKPTNL